MSEEEMDYPLQPDLDLIGGQVEELDDHLLDWLQSESGGPDRDDDFAAHLLLDEDDYHY